MMKRTYIINHITYEHNVNQKHILIDAATKTLKLIVW